jgi:hypothetical protein
MSMLTVEFDRAPTGYVRVEAFTNTGEDRQIIECREATDCPRGVVFPDYTPDRVTIRITNGTSSSDTLMRPRYQTVYPNGRLCSPECRQATVRVTLPADGR